MALVVTTKEEKYDYVPLLERGQKDPFTVVIRRLTPKEFSFIEDKLARMNQDQSITFTSGSYNWEVVKKGIIGWSNIEDERGRPLKIVIGSEGATDSSLNYIPTDYINELAGVIVGVTKSPENADLYLGKGEFEEPVEEPVEELKEEEPVEEKKPSVRKRKAN